MKGLFNKEVLGHPLVIASIAAVFVIALGSGAYYSINSRVPSPDVGPAAAATSTISVSGVISPAQNPDLAFEAGGRVARVSVAVGQEVAQGAVLASLDTAALSAARDQAAANVAVQQAKLDEMQAGPRPVDISQKQTAVLQAQQSLANLYGSIRNDIAQSYSSVLGATYADADTLFSNANTSAPSLLFTSTDSQSAQDSISSRVSLGVELAAWKQESDALGSDPAAIEKALGDVLLHAQAARTFGNTLTAALGGAITSSSFTQSSLTTAETSLAAFRAAAQSAVSTLQTDQQTLANDKLAIQSAQDALAAAQAGSTAQDIEAQKASLAAAQASLKSAEAALGNAIVTAPYAGTVTAVHVKPGDFVSPNGVAVSLAPHSALELDAYLSEVDAARVSPGDRADVTLDAYGASRIFPAAVASVNRSPSMQNGVPAYRVVIQFAQNDPALSPGVSGNVTLYPSR